MLMVYWSVFGVYASEKHSDQHSFPRAVVGASTIRIDADEPNVCTWFVPGTIDQED